MTSKPEILYFKASAKTIFKFLGPNNITLNFVNKEKEKELFQFCLQHNNITLFVYCIGQWDFEINIKIDSMPAFHELLKEIKARFSEIIKECESVIIFKEHKFNRFPGAYPTGS